jgi:hypothetical protein
MCEIKQNKLKSLIKVLELNLPDLVPIEAEMSK